MKNLSDQLDHLVVSRCVLSIGDNESIPMNWFKPIHWNFSELATMDWLRCIDSCKNALMSAMFKALPSRLPETDSPTFASLGVHTQLACIPAYHWLEWFNRFKRNLIEAITGGLSGSRWDQILFRRSGIEAETMQFPRLASSISSWRFDRHSACLLVIVY